MYKLSGVYKEEAGSHLHARRNLSFFHVQVRQKQQLEYGMHYVRGERDSSRVQQ
jgi:hypothetical protein